MHPAYSVILFTTASGAGYGLLALLGLAAATGAVPPAFGFGLASLGLAFGLITLGLLASTFHLGHPERSLRAFSQWRSSWLSREGVCAVATYGPAGLFAILWLAGSGESGLCRALGLLSAGLALATVWCTAMIYASLKTIPQWSEPLVVAGYLALSLATGGVLFVALTRLFGLGDDPFLWVALALVVLAWAVKLAYWRRIDAAPRRLSIEAATRLGHLGPVRQLDPPHTETNFVMSEMGYRVARKHAVKLRLISLALGFVAPIAALLLALAVGGPVADALSLLAVLSAGAGVLVERWLFFAEARHVVTLYYGAARA